MTRDVDPAGIVSLTEYDLAVRASERTQMSRDEILKLEGVEFRCRIAAALGWKDTGATWTLPSGQVVQCLRDWDTRRDWSLKILEFIGAQQDYPALRGRFLDELGKLSHAEHLTTGGDLWRGLLATPRQICQAFLLAQRAPEA
jgi:hypothetical protein